MTNIHLKERARKLKDDIPAIFIALKKKETPVCAKLMAAVTVAYALSPIDLIPDFIPVLGYIDDLILLPAMAALTIKLIPSDIMNECRTQTADMWKNSKPKKWYYSIPIAMIWLLIIILIIRKIIK